MLAILIVIHTIFREFDLLYLLSIIARMFIPLAKKCYRIDLVFLLNIDFIYTK